MPDSDRILIIRPGALGDTVLTEPVVAAVRAAHPAARIDLAGRTDFLPLLVGPDLADACRSTDAAEFTSLFTDGPLELPESDVVLAFLPDPDGALERKLHAHTGRAVVFDPRPAPGATVHIVDRLLAALDQLGISAVRREPRIACRDLWRAEARLALGHDGDYAVIHPGSGGRSKLWQPEKWADVIAALHPLRVVLTVGPADEATAAEVLARIARRPEPLVLSGRPVTTLAGLLAGAKTYIGCDSGVTHLAAALGVPTVAVFGPTDPRLWRPRGRHVRIAAGPDRTTASVHPADVL